MNLLFACLFFCKHLKHPFCWGEIYAQTNLAKAALNPHKNSWPNCAALAFESDSAEPLEWQHSGTYTPYTTSIKGSWGWVQGLGDNGLREGCLKNTRIRHGGSCHR